MEQLTKMDILHSMIPFSQMLKGINDNINTPAERLDEYRADYKKRCDARGANFQRSKRLKWLIKRLLELGVNLELARIEELHDEIEAAEMEEMKAVDLRLKLRSNAPPSMLGSKKSAHSVMTSVSIGERSVMPNKQDAHNAESAWKREEHKQC